MADGDDLQFYESRFGGLRLWLSKISTDKTRNQVIHEPSAGDRYVVDDRGRAPMKSRLSLLFDEMTDLIQPMDRLRTFITLIDEKPRLFQHPVEGTYLARVADFTYDIDENGTITGECTVTPVEEPRAVDPAGAGSIPAAGQGAVDDAAAALSAELADVGVTSTLPAEARAAVDAWSADDDINPRAVLADTGSLTQRIGDLASALEGSLDTWQAFKAAILLADAVRAAAETVTAAISQTFQVKIGAPVALRALVASTYGADDADLRYQQVLQLNDVSSPAWVETGTVLQMPMQTPAARNA